MVVAAPAVQRDPEMVKVVPVVGCKVGSARALCPGRCPPGGRGRRYWCPVEWLEASLRWRVALPLRLLKGCPLKGLAVRLYLLLMLMGGVDVFPILAMKVKAHGRAGGDH